MKHFLNENRMRLIVAIFFFNCISLFAQENLIEDNDQQFINYLKNTLEDDVVNAQTTEIFYQRSWAFWGSNLEDYILRWRNQAFIQTLPII